MKGKINYCRLLISILLTVGAGFLSGYLSGSAGELYGRLNLPLLSPPSIVFPIVWGILYLLMGISFYFIWQSSVDKDEKTTAYLWFFAQLALNFVWSILFFRFEWFLVSFVWILAMIVAVYKTYESFMKIDKRAANLLIPYLIWLIFAAYLSLGVWLLN